MHQTSRGRQGSGLWSRHITGRHINYRELLVVLIILRREPGLKNMAILVLADNTAEVPCLNKQGSSRSRRLLHLPEKKILLTAKRRISLQSSPTGKNRFMDGRPIAARPFYGGVGRHPKIQILVAVVRLRIGYVRLDKMSFSRGKVRSLIQRFRIQWKLY